VVQDFKDGKEKLFGWELDYEKTSKNGRDYSVGYKENRKWNIKIDGLYLQGYPIKLKNLITLGRIVNCSINPRYR
jgi:hypothetical protein